MNKRHNQCFGRCNKRSLFDDDACRCYCGPYESYCSKCEKNLKNSPVNTFNPSITINVSTGTTPPPYIGLETAQYMTLAKEGKKIYTNQDALKQYGSSDILSPDNVSYTNLFINGVLQPPSIYDVEEGVLYLKSSDLPPNEAPIILLFVMVKK